MANNDPRISWPLYRPAQRAPWSAESHANGHAHTTAPLPAYPPCAPPSPGTILQTTLPMGPRSLAGIAMRAGLLGVTFSSSIMYSVYLLNQSSHFWRVPFFLAVLSLFHFLEFWCTARYNPLKADVSSFLLSINGWAYNTAHTCALLECVFWYTFFPDYRLPFWPESWHYLFLGLGLATLVVGQIIRSAAMAIAGANFNHTVQFTRREGHVLVTNGVFAYFRHPSYFGFFWWGLATQMVLGNVLSFLLYAVVLWLFFRARIESKIHQVLGARTLSFMFDRELTRGDVIRRRRVAGKVLRAGIRGLPSADVDLGTIRNMVSLWKTQSVLGMGEAHGFS
ncbi:hypothetical protein MMC34_001381 [Xylographa carneopallida]|nr:hypothetical protein [Xylographa carneopallida]